ncbi:MAG: HupE/UreJ family protein [Rhodocyclaceae bacterium]
MMVTGAPSKSSTRCHTSGLAPRQQERGSRPRWLASGGRILVALALLLVGTAAFAHKPSDSYLSLRIDHTELQGQWDIALRDLDHVLGLDADQDGALTWGEVRRRHADIAAYALARFALAADGSACAISVTGNLVDRHSDGAYAVLRLGGTCPHAPRELQATYGLLFDADPQHRGLLRLEHRGETRTAIFSADAPTQTFQLAESARWRQFIDYLKHGVWHIWIGFDHILFLLALLLPAVLIWSERHWQPAAHVRSALWEVLRVVTAFTVAHSITLSLAALGVVSLPSRWVESAIAASVVLAALNNIFPVVLSRRWLIAFVFGLIHGFGFASVLADLGLPRGALLLALVAFNLGVEIGQLAIVAAFLPLAWLLRRSRFYRRLILAGGSAAVMALATLWLVERAFDLRLFA